MAFAPRARVESRPMHRLFPAVLALALVACTDDSMRIGPIEDQQVYVGEFLRVPFRVRNAGTPDYVVAFSGPELPNLDRWAYAVRRPGGGEFQWSPTLEHVGEHTITIKADNGQTRVSRTFRVEVLGAREASPVFHAPGQGLAVDLTRTPCIRVPVDVRDRDTAELDLAVVFGMPVGARFEDLGGGRGEFSWCPSRDQIAASAQWVVTFEASDGEHEPVPHDLRIVLQVPSKEPCGGALPTVEFLEPSDAESIVSRVGYDIRIRVSDDRPLRERPGLFYTDGRIEQRDQIALDAMRFVPFRPTAEPDVWYARIPTFRLAEDEAKNLAMVPWVTDDDDPNGTRCDNALPRRIRRFTAVGAVEAGVLEVCEPCLVSGDCISAACLRTPLGGYCVPSCLVREPDCETGTCSFWNSMEGVVREACGDAEQICLGLPACRDDALEPNGDVAAATPLRPGAPVSASVCERDDDWFALASGPERRVRAVLTAAEGSARDFELRMVRPDATIAAVAAIDGGTATTETCVRAGEALSLHVFSPTLTRGDYRLSVEAIGEACACDDDAFEPDGAGTPRPLSDRAEGTICGFDSDTFALAGRPGERTTIALDIAPGDGAGDLDFDVIAPDGSLVAASRGVGSSEALSADLREDGPYLVRVFSYDGGDADYALSVSREPLDGCTASRECAADEACFDGLCRRERCNRNADCPVGAICPLVAVGVERTCLDACERDTECGVGAVCKDFFEGRACYAVGEGETGAGCSEASDCAGNRVCVDWPGGHCAAAGCERGPICGDDATCAVVDGRATCVETCWVSDEECFRGNGQACSELFSPIAELVYGCSPTTR